MTLLPERPSLQAIYALRTALEAIDEYLQLKDDQTIVQARSMIVARFLELLTKDAGPYNWQQDACG